MSRFACIAPIHIARELKKRDLLGGYHLLLAHEVAAASKAFSEVYGSYPDNLNTIIMDNGVIELGKAVDIETMHKAVSITGAQYVILPDVLGDKDGTLDAISTVIEDYTDLARQYKLGLMGVPHGHNYSKTVVCAEQMWKHWQIHFFGVPRRLTNDTGSRMGVTIALRELGLVHLLGFSDNLVDDVACARIPRVLGIDSSAVTTTSAAGMYISLDSNYRRPRDNNDPNWWNNMPYTTLLEPNLERIRKWIGETE